jgi:hypothetical protein
MLLGRFDRNAIIVLKENSELGFIDRNLAQVLATEIDPGLTLMIVTEVLNKMCLK